MTTVRTTPSTTLVELVDELLEAHVDTIDMADRLIGDSGWELHVRYLQALQRAGQAMLAGCNREITR